MFRICPSSQPDRSIGQIDPLALRAHMITIEISGALFELGEILNERNDRFDP